MAQLNHTQRLARTEEALSVLFCRIDDAYTLLNPNGKRYERLSDSEVITLTLLHQLRGVESERSYLRDTERFFSDLFPGVVGLHPSSLHRRVRTLRRLEWSPCAGRWSLSWWAIPKPFLSTPPCLVRCTPCSGRSVRGFSGSGLAEVGFFQRPRVKLHLLCATNGVPISYELTPFRTWRRCA
jgi:hypothetical protein